MAGVRPGRGVYRNVAAGATRWRNPASAGHARLLAGLRTARGAGAGPGSRRRSKRSRSWFSRKRRYEGRDRLRLGAEEREGRRRRADLGGVEELERPPPAALLRHGRLVLLHGVVLSQRLRSAVGISRSAASRSASTRSKSLPIPAPVSAEMRQHRRVGHEAQAVGELLAKASLPRSESACWVDEIPLVRQHQDRPAPLARQARHLGVLVGEALALRRSAAAPRGRARGTRTVISALTRSVVSTRRPTRRSPAVSTSVKRSPSRSRWMSTESRVVPGTSETTTRSRRPAD